MASLRDEQMESYVRGRLGIGLPPGREQLPSLRLRLENGLELEKDSLISEVRRVSLSNMSIIGDHRNELGITAVLDGIGKDLDSMMSSVRSFKDLKERLY